MSINAPHKPFCSQTLPVERPRNIRREQHIHLLLRIRHTANGRFCTDVRGSSRMVHCWYVAVILNFTKDLWVRLRFYYCALRKVSFIVVCFVSVFAVWTLCFLCTSLAPEILCSLWEGIDLRELNKFRICDTKRETYNDFLKAFVTFFSRLPFLRNTARDMCSKLNWNNLRFVVFLGTFIINEKVRVLCH